MSPASLLRRPLYRTRQVWWSLRSKVRREEVDEARALLGERLFAAFRAMDPPDQRHCLDVYRAAKGMGCTDQDVLTAALIHDCGKAPDETDGRLRLWHRASYVALLAVAPGLLRRLSRRPGGLRLLNRHAERGIEIARECGASVEVLDLLRRMEGGEDGDGRVRVLREADDRA